MPWVICVPTPKIPALASSGSPIGGDEPPIALHQHLDGQHDPRDHRGHGEGSARRTATSLHEERAENGCKQIVEPDEHCAEHH